MEQQEGQIDDKELDAIFNADDSTQTEDVVQATSEDTVEGSEVREESTEVKADSSEGTKEEVVEDPSPSNYDALKKEFDSLQHKYKSDEGRVSALQRQINELQKVNNTLNRASQPRQVAKPKPKIDSKKIVDDLYSGDEDKAKAAVEALVSQQPTANTVDVERRMNQVVQPLLEAEKERSKATQEQALAEVYPDWREQVNSSEFSEWLGGLPKPVQQLVHSNESSDAVYMLNQFNKSKPTSVVEDERTKVEKIQDKRDKQLADGTGLSSKHSAGASGGMPSDPDALFDYLERNDPDLKSAYRR
jgi:hypothetical protein